MNEIIKGMPNASEAIQENFEELSQAKTSHDTRLTTVEQNTDLLSQKVVAGKQSIRTTTERSYVEFFADYPPGFNAQNTTVAAASQTPVAGGITLYQVSPQTSQVRLRLRTLDGSAIPVDTVITIQYQFVRIDD